ncbi:MAG TPA: hypothetical protein VJA26_05225 [Gammaproteobacteria bacterium]|nr:hypothetical protein [Gammaproteobacteria bacterium]
MFALIGAAIRERSADFDIPGQVLASEELQQLDRQRKWQATLDRAYGSIRKDPTHALHFAGRFIERLIEAGREINALELVAQCRRLSRDFAVPAQSAARLAEYARAIGRHGTADELADFSRRVPHP